jgi:hypothetical protein
MAMANPTKPAGTAGATNEWGNTFGCFEDIAGCLYCYCCGTCCMRCEIGNSLGMAPMGPKPEAAKDFMGFGGQCLNCLATDCGLCCTLIGLCACQEKTCCFYDKYILEGYAKAMNKSKVSPGPCDDPCMQMWCCGPCTICLMYRELKLKPCGTPEPAPTFTNMNRA